MSTSIKALLPQTVMKLQIQKKKKKAALRRVSKQEVQDSEDGKP